MADIFISYSKQDQSLAKALAVFLESEGYSVWWDTNIRTGETFSRVILEELEKAATVIVIWTNNSVKSEWVQSEAGRARNNGKLVPVKLPSMTYDRIPPPFDVIHTENVNEKERLLETLQAQVRRPQLPNITVVALAKRIRHEALMWFGVIGTVITLMNSIRPLITLAHWVRAILDSYTYLNDLLWLEIFRIFNFHIAPPFPSILSSNIFIIVIGFSCSKFSLQEYFAGSKRSRAEQSVIGLDRRDLRRYLPIFALIALIWRIALGFSPIWSLSGLIAESAVTLFGVMAITSILFLWFSIILELRGRFRGNLRIFSQVGFGLALLLANVGLWAAFARGGRNAIPLSASVISIALACYWFRNTIFQHWVISTGLVWVLSVFFAFYGPMAIVVTAGAVLYLVTVFTIGAVSIALMLGGLFLSVAVAERSKLYNRIVRSFVLLLILIGMNYLSTLVDAGLQVGWLWLENELFSLKC